MRKGLKFHISKHMAQRAVDRELSLEAVKDVVCYADEEKRLRNGDNGGIVYKFKKTDSRALVVIAEIRNNNCWLATAYYES